MPRLGCNDSARMFLLASRDEVNNGHYAYTKPDFENALQVWVDGIPFDDKPYLRLNPSDRSSRAMRLPAWHVTCSLLCQVSESLSNRGLREVILSAHLLVAELLATSLAY